MWIYFSGYENIENEKERQKQKERRYKNCYEIKSINLLNTQK